MLNIMRKQAGSWMIKVILFAIVVVFVFWGVGSMRSRKATQVADINGEIVTQADFKKAYYQLVDTYRRVYGSQFNEDLLKQLNPNEMVLNQLINNALMMQEAKRLDIEIGKEELTDKIRSMPAFQNNGSFDYQRYNLLLAQNRLSPEEFESQLSNEIIMERVRTAVLSGVTISDDEARQWYEWAKAKVNLMYLLFRPTRYNDVEPSEAQIKAQYGDHADNYRTEPKIKVRYLFFDPQTYQKDVSIDEEQIAAYYQDHPAEFKKDKRVKARHILIKVDEDADDKTVEKKRSEIQKIHGMAVAGQDFATLAKQYSEGPSKDKGGDLGWFTHDMMVKPFADNAFSLKAGDIGEPVRTRFGWHIIKVEQVEEASTTALETAKDTIRKQVIEQKAKDLALKDAEEVYDSVFDGDDLAAVGQNRQIPVATTDFFTLQGPEDKSIGQVKKFASVSFGLKTMDVSDIQDLGNGYYILQVVERVESTVPPLEQVIEKVKADVIKSLQDQRAKADAEALLEKVKQGEGFETAAEASGIEVKETGLFERSGTIPQIGYEPQISKEAFQLSSDAPLFESAIQGRQGWYAIKLKSRQAPEDEGFAKEKKEIVERLIEQKRKSAFQKWLDELRSKSKIKVNKELARM